MLSLLAVYAGLLVLAPLCALAQRRWPERTPVDPVFARERAVHWSFWLITPLFTGVLTRSATLGLVGVAALAGWNVADGPLSTLPAPAQLLAALIIADAVGYVSHRVRHSRALWRFHALHHSPRKLDWLAAATLHPVDDVIDNVAVGAVLLACGVRFEIFAAMGPVLLLHTLYLHMNVTWTLGPLQRVLASPAFHRWHHSREKRDVNFAGMFAFIDVLGGTFHMPEGARPVAFGAD